MNKKLEKIARENHYKILTVFLDDEAKEGLHYSAALCKLEFNDDKNTSDYAFIIKDIGYAEGTTLEDTYDNLLKAYMENTNGHSND